MRKFVALPLLALLLLLMQSAHAACNIVGGKAYGDCAGVTVRNGEKAPVGADADLSHFRDVRRSFGEPARRFRTPRRCWGLSQDCWLTRASAAWLNPGPAPTRRMTNSIRQTVTTSHSAKWRSLKLTGYAVVVVKAMVRYRLWLEVER